MACFRSDKDRYVFLDCLRDALGKGGCALHSFVLMTNHVHLLAIPTVTGAMPRIMQSVGTRYARYFNKTYERTGPLFGARYWASLIETERYLMATMRYIELNPVRAGMVDSPCRYPWSSYLHNIGKEKRDFVSPHTTLLELGRTPTEGALRWAEFVDQGIAQDELTRLRKHFTRSQVLGSDTFVEQFDNRPH